MYEVPLSCKHVYIGQTGRCYNERAREHDWAVNNNAEGHLVGHCKCCNDTKFLACSSDKLEREILEAFYIARAGGTCISSLSVVLADKEVAF